MLCGGILASSPPNLARLIAQEIKSSISSASAKEIREVLTSELVFPGVPHVCLMPLQMIVSESISPLTVEDKFWTEVLCASFHKTRL